MNPEQAYKVLLRALKDAGVEDVLRSGKGVEHLPMREEHLEPTPYTTPEAIIMKAMDLMKATNERMEGRAVDVPALQRYRGAGYRVINGRLRDDPHGYLPESPLTQELEREAPSDIMMLNDLINSGLEFPYDIKVHRGIANRRGDFNRFLRDRAAGDEVGNIGFLSTSPDKRVAENFMSHLNDPIMTTITIPAGERVLPVGGFESEMLIGPRRSFSLDKIQKNRGQWNLDLTLQRGKQWLGDSNDRGRLIGGGALGALMLPEGDDEE